MTGDGARADGPLPTGGAAGERVQAKRWWMSLVRLFDGVLDSVVREDPLDRRPGVAVVGEGAEDWLAWFTVRGARADLELVDVAVCVDALAPLDTPDAVSLVRELHDRVTVGGRLVLVERAVRTDGRAARAVDELFVVVSRATGGAVTLYDVHAVARPGEHTVTTAVVELVRLATPGRP